MTDAWIWFGRGWLPWPVFTNFLRWVDGRVALPYSEEVAGRNGQAWRLSGRTYVVSPTEDGRCLRLQQTAPADVPDRYIEADRDGEILVAHLDPELP